MKLIRRNTFETNSSSTHSLTMCSENDFDKWKNGELYYCDDDGQFYNEEERLKIIKQHIIHDKAEYDNGNLIYKGITVKYGDSNKLYTEENLAEITNEEIENYLEDGYDYYEIPITYDEWDAMHEELEIFNQKYTSENGDNIVAFGYYGYEG